MRITGHREFHNLCNKTFSRWVEFQFLYQRKCTKSTSVVKTLVEIFIWPYHREILVRLACSCSAAKSIGIQLYSMRLLSIYLLYVRT